MKRFLLYLVYAYIALSVQAIFFTGVRPDLVIVLVCCYSLKYGYTKGAAYGALTGLLIDTAGGFILGPNIISKSLAALLVKTIRDRILDWNMLVHTITVALITAVDIIIVYFCHDLFLEGSFSARLWTVAPRALLFTVIAALFAYNFFSLNKDSGLREEI